MRISRRVLVAWLAAAIVAYGQGNTFEKIRYNGGTLQTDVNPKDWENRLTVSPDEIVLELKDGQKLRIDPKRVHGLSYGQEAHRRVGTMVALGILLAAPLALPLALFGLFHNTRLHFVGIEFTTEEGKTSGLLLQAHKDNYRAVLMALRGATGAPIAAAQEDRKYVPTGVETVRAESKEKRASEPETGSVTPSPADESKHTAPPVVQQTTQPEPRGAEYELSTIAVKSTPDAAEINVDGKYVGSTPSTVRLTPGEHVLSIEKSGFKTWQRTMTVNPGGIVTIDATLEKNP